MRNKKERSHRVYFDNCIFINVYNDSLGEGFSEAELKKHRAISKAVRDHIFVNNAMGVPFITNVNIREFIGRSTVKGNHKGLTAGAKLLRTLKSTDVNKKSRKLKRIINEASPCAYANLSDMHSFDDAEGNIHYLNSYDDVINLYCHHEHSKDFHDLWRIVFGDGEQSDNYDIVRSDLEKKWSTRGKNYKSTQGFLDDLAGEIMKIQKKPLTPEEVEAKGLKCYLIMSAMEVIKNEGFRKRKGEFNLLNDFLQMKTLLQGNSTLITSDRSLFHMGNAVLYAAGATSQIMYFNYWGAVKSNYPIGSIALCDSGLDDKGKRFEESNYLFIVSRKPSALLHKFFSLEDNFTRFLIGD